MNLYRYLGNGVLQPVSGYPQNITAFGSSDDLGWIHLDAYKLNEFVITWQEHGQILAKAGSANNNFIMGNTAVLDNSSIDLPQAIQPDVALVRSVQSGGSLMAHFVYTDPPKHRLVVSTLSFDDIISTPAPLTLLTPTFEDDQQNANYFFNRPRIDAPDDYNYDDWSYVVARADTATLQQVIYTGVMNNALGTLFHFNLNNGSLNPALLDISQNAPFSFHDNYQPVVAYGSGGQNIYYCWNYYSNIDPPAPLISDYAYIGLKIDNTGNLQGLPIQYWLVQTSPADISPTPSIALSGQNTSSPGLFMAFSQSVSPLQYHITTKLNPWNQVGFRPNQGTGIDKYELQSTMQVAPNPFKDGFQLYVKTPDNQTYKMQLTDALGRFILGGKGTLPELNVQFTQTKLDQLPSGYYFLKLWKSDNAVWDTTFKLVKTQ